jgi:hypothetical protein
MAGRFPSIAVTVLVSAFHRSLLHKSTVDGL